MTSNEKTPSTSEPVLAFAGRKTNAEAIRDLATLGHITTEDVIADMTYGLGRFWSLWKPDRLLRYDLDPVRSPDALGGLDATDTLFADGTFDVVVVDPPYKLNGTASKGGPASSDVDYGVGDGYRSIAQRHNLMTEMLMEAARITRRVVLFKCQAQVSSGRVQWQDHLFAAQAEESGLRHVDTLFVEGYREQPPGRTQKTARRNYSSLLVFEKAKR